MSFTLGGPDYAAIANIIGLTTLRARYPALTGAGIRVGQVEGSSSGTEGGIDFEVDPASLGHPANNADHFLTYYNGLFRSFTYNDGVLGSFSNHATVQAGFFYNPTPYLGAPQGVAPGVAHVDSYIAAGFLNNLAAGALPDKVVNLSVLYLGADVDPAFDAAANLGNTVFVAAAGNGGTPGMPSSAYNVISVDTWPAVQAIGPAADGVPKPDISAPQTVTSRTTAIVSGAATLLVQAGATAANPSDAVDFRTIKALLLNGASKPADYYTTVYAPTPDQPLNAVYGAGVVNVLASVETLFAGEQAPTAVRAVPSGGATFAPIPGVALAASGWSLATTSAAAGQDAVHDYVLSLTAGTAYVATLTWAADATNAIDTLDLVLFDGVSGTVLASSTSTSSNVQQIDVTPGHDGRYDLTVRLHGDAAAARSDRYALAFAPATPAAPVACFAQGTRIATDAGEVPVEALRIGQPVRSAFGGLVPVEWLGWRHVDCRRHPSPRDVWPIRVQAGAFGQGQPARHLLLSPDHAVHVEDVLIPVRHLVNGTSIRQERVSEVTYFHVELPTHDVIFAEGLAVESYLDTGNRTAFANGGPIVEAHPDFAQRVWEAEACAPQITHGPILARVAARLRARRNDVNKRRINAS